MIAWERTVFWLLCAAFVGMSGWLASTQAPALIIMAFSALAGWPLVRSAYLHGLQDARAAVGAAETP